MGNLPSWCAPLLGAAVGAGMAGWAMQQDGLVLKPPELAVACLSGATAGALAGGIVWLMDRMRGSRPRPAQFAVPAIGAETTVSIPKPCATPARIPNCFYRRTWIAWVNVVVMVNILAFSVAHDVAVLSEVPSQFGRQYVGASGWVILLFPLFPLVILYRALLYLHAARQPMVRLCREGIEFPRIPVPRSSSWWRTVGALAYPFRLVIGDVSKRTGVVRIAWSRLVRADIEGLPSRRVLVVEEMRETTARPRAWARIAEHLVAGNLDDVVEAIWRVYHDPSCRSLLPSWSENSPRRDR